MKNNEAIRKSLKELLSQTEGIITEIKKAPESKSRIPKAFRLDAVSEDAPRELTLDVILFLEEFEGKKGNIFKFFIGNQTGYSRLSIYPLHEALKKVESHLEKYSE